MSSREALVRALVTHLYSAGSYRRKEAAAQRGRPAAQVAAMNLP